MSIMKNFSKIEVTKKKDLTKKKKPEHNENTSSSFTYGSNQFHNVFGSAAYLK